MNYHFACQIEQSHIQPVHKFDGIKTMLCSSAMSKAVRCQIKKSQSSVEKFLMTLSMTHKLVECLAVIAFRTHNFYWFTLISIICNSIFAFRNF